MDVQVGVHSTCSTYSMEHIYASKKGLSKVPRMQGGLCAATCSSAPAAPARLPPRPAARSPAGPRWLSAPLQSSVRLLRPTPSACPLVAHHGKVPGVGRVVDGECAARDSVAELSRRTLAAPLMLRKLPDTAPVTTARPQRRCRWL